MTTPFPPPPPGFQIVDAAPPPPPPGFQTVQPAQDESSWLLDALGTADGYAASAADGTRQGVAMLLGAPVDIANELPRLLNLLPGEQGFTRFTDNPIGGRDTMDQLLRGGGIIPDYEPQSWGERVVNRAGEEIGAAAIPTAAALGTATRVGTQGARAMQTSGGVLKRLFGEMVETAAVNPGRFAGKEAAYATGAGTGAGVAREFVSDDDPNTTTPAEAAADVFGALTGAGGVAAAEGVGSALGNTARAVTGAGGDRIVRETVTDQLARAGNASLAPSGARDTSGLAEAIAMGARNIAETAPNFAPTTASTIDSVGMRNLEYGRRTGPNSGMFSERRADNAVAANQSVDELAPTGDAAQFRLALDMNADAALEDAALRQYLAKTEFDKAAENLRAVQTSEARGQTVRAALDDALTKAREVEREAWSAVQGESDPAPLAQTFDEITRGLTLAEQQAVATARDTLDIPSRLVPDTGAEDDLLTQLTGAGEPAAVNIAEITGLRSRLTTAQRQADASGDPNQSRILQKYVDAVDGYLDGMPEVGPALQEARVVSRDLNDRFTRRGTGVADTLATRPSGGPVVPDSQVTPRFTQADQRQASEIDNLLRETGNDQNVRAAVRDQLVADVQSRGLLDSPERLDAYLQQNSQVFERFPELRDEFGTASKLRQQVDAASATQQAAERTFAPGAPSAVGQFRKFGPEDALNSARSITAAPDPAAAVRELLDTVGRDPGSVENLRSAVWKVLESRAKPMTQSNRLPDGTDPWEMTRLVRALDDPKIEGAMRELYADNPEHIDNLRALASALRNFDTSTSGRVAGSSGTPQSIQGNAVMPSTETLGAYSFAYQRGQIGLPYIGLRLASTMARKAALRGRAQEFNDLLDAALLNPELAAQLLRENNPANAAALARTAKTVIGNRALWLDEMLGDEGEDDDLMQTLEDQ